MDKALQYRQTFEVRATNDGGGISGYSSTHWKVDSYGTAMAPGCFQKSLSERGDRIPILLNHDIYLNVGIPDVQREDDKGLYIEATIFDDGADGTTLMRRLRAGARYGMSFGFRNLQDRSATEDDPLDLSQVPGISRSEVRVYTENKLYEHSIVTFPANEAAEITGVRHQARADALTSLLDDITQNRLSEDEQALMARIVAAFPQAAPGSTAAPRTTRSARRLDADLALARFRYLAPELITG